MKRRFIAMLVAAVMVLSMIPAMSFTVSAADIEGDWDTFRGANAYIPPEDGSEHRYAPAGGYEYTSEGFQVIGADYSETTPFNTVQSKEKQNLKDGVYMEFRIDEYDYSGESGNADNWICITLWDGQAPVPGDTKYGAGWLCLIRDNAGFGNDQTIEAFNVVAYEEGVNPGGFNHQGNSTSRPVVDSDGLERYTFEVSFDGTNYDIKVCGVSVAGLAATNAHLNGLDPNGEFYVGVTMMSTIKGGKAAMTILKYGTDADSATTPVGSDSKEPEENPNQPPAPIADASTVEANQPCIIYNADTVSKPSAGNMNVTPMGDGSFHVQATQAGAYITFGPKRDVSYSAQDFPVVGVLIRNCWAGTGNVWYYSGDIMSANGEYQSGWSPYDGDVYGEDDEYSFCIIDLTDMWAEGRINGIRVDFNGIDVSSEDAEFDICWVGHFRSAEEAAAYNISYLTGKGVITEGGEEDTTESPTDDTQAPDADTTPAGDDTTDGTTPAGDDTAAGTDAATEGDTTAEESGCASIVAGSAAILMAAAAAVVLRKKH